MIVKKKSSVRTRLPFPEKLALMQYMPENATYSTNCFRFPKSARLLFIFTILTILTYMDSSNAARSQVWISRCARIVGIYGRFCGTFTTKAQSIHVMKLSSISCEKVFPISKMLVFELTGPNAVYASFAQKGRQNPIPVLGVSEGQLQMLIHLTALFSEEIDIDIDQGLTDCI